MQLSTHIKSFVAILPGIWIAMHGVASNPKLISISTVLLVLAGLVLCIRDRRVVVDSWNSHSKIFLLPMFAFFLVTTIAWADGGFAKVSKIETLVKMMLYFICVFSLARVYGASLNRSIIIGGLFFALGFFARGIWFLEVEQDAVPRNSILYVNMGLVISILVYCVSRAESSHMWRLIGAGTIVSAVVVSYLMEVRGSWLAWPWLMLLFVGLLDISFRKKLVLFVFFPLAAASLYFTEIGGRNIREAAKNETSPRHSSKMCGSTGVRAAQWGIAVKMFEDDPLLGVGYGNEKAYRQKLIDQGEYPQCVSVANIHSDYFGALARSGGLGLIALISLYLSLIIYSFRKIRLNDSGKVYYCGVLGVALQYATASLTNEMLFHSISLATFVISLAVLLGIAASNKTATAPIHMD